MAPKDSIATNSVCNSNNNSYNNQMLTNPKMVKKNVEMCS